MKTIFSLSLFLMLSSIANAAPESANSATGVDPAANKKGTQLSFDDLLVQGKYHFADEAVTTVEQDKVLDALLGIPTDFKDRIKSSTSKY